MSRITTHEAQTNKPSLTLLDKWMACKMVMADRELSASAKNLMFALLDHYNLKTTRCDPSMGRLANFIGLSRRRAVAVLRELEVAGWVRTSPVCGGRNSFAIAFEKASATDVELGTPDNGDTTGRYAENGAGGYDERITGGYDASVIQTREEEKEKNIRKESLSPSPLGDESDAIGAFHPPAPKHIRPSQIDIESADADFGAFWTQYPKKDDPKAARRAYQRARREGASAADILAGCVRYAAERAAVVSERPEQARFTKSAARWLDAGAWLNEPAAAPRACSMAPPNDRWTHRGEVVADVVVRMALEARDECEAERARLGGYDLPTGAF